MSSIFCYYLRRHKVYIGEYMIHKKLRQLGNSWGVVIPKAILEALNINPVIDEISISIENNSIKIDKYKIK